MTIEIPSPVRTILRDLSTDEQVQSPAFESLVARGELVTAHDDFNAQRLALDWLQTLLTTAGTRAERRLALQLLANTQRTLGGEIGDLNQSTPYETAELFKWYLEQTDYRIIQTKKDGSLQVSRGLNGFARIEGDDIVIRLKDKTGNISVRTISSWEWEALCKLRVLQRQRHFRNPLTPAPWLANLQERLDGMDIVLLPRPVSVPAAPEPAIKKPTRRTLKPFVDRVPTAKPARQAGDLLGLVLDKFGAVLKEGSYDGLLIRTLETHTRQKPDPSTRLRLTEPHALDFVRLLRLISHQKPDPLLTEAISFFTTLPDAKGLNLMTLESSKNIQDIRPKLKRLAQAQAGHVRIPAQKLLEWLDLARYFELEAAHVQEVLSLLHELRIQLGVNLLEKTDAFIRELDQYLNPVKTAATSPAQKAAASGNAVALPYGLAADQPSPHTGLRRQPVTHGPGGNIFRSRAGYDSRALTTQLHDFSHARITQATNLTSSRRVSFHSPISALSPRSGSAMWHMRPVNLLWR